MLALLVKRVLGPALALFLGSCASQTAPGVADSTAADAVEETVDVPKTAGRVTWFYDGVRLTRYDIGLDELTDVSLNGSSLPHDDALLDVPPLERLGGNGNVAPGMTVSSDGRWLAYCLYPSPDHWLPCDVFVYDLETHAETKIGQSYDYGLYFRGARFLEVSPPSNGTELRPSRIYDPWDADFVVDDLSICRTAWLGSGIDVLVARGPEAETACWPTTRLDRLTAAGRQTLSIQWASPWMAELWPISRTDAGDAVAFMINVREPGVPEADYLVRCDLVAGACSTLGESRLGLSEVEGGLKGAFMSDSRVLSRDGLSAVTVETVSPTWVEKVSLLHPLSQVAATHQVAPGERVGTVWALDGGKGTLINVLRPFPAEDEATRWAGRLMLLDRVSGSARSIYESNESFSYRVASDEKTALVAGHNVRSFGHGTSTGPGVSVRRVEIDGPVGPEMQGTLLAWTEDHHFALTHRGWEVSRVDLVNGTTRLVLSWSSADIYVFSPTCEGWCL